MHSPHLHPKKEQLGNSIFLADLSMDLTFKGNISNSPPYRIIHVSFILQMAYYMIVRAVTNGPI